MVLKLIFQNENLDIFCFQKQLGIKINLSEKPVKFREFSFEVLGDTLTCRLNWKTVILMVSTE